MIKPNSLVSQVSLCTKAKQIKNWWALTWFTKSKEEITLFSKYHIIEKQAIVCATI